MKQFMTWLTASHRGSNVISQWLRKRIECRSIQELIGIPLAGLAFFGAVVLPQAQAGFYSTEVYFDTRATTINAVVEPSRFRWPLAAFGISQYFHGGHPGMDLTNPAGTPIYPVADGKVILVASLFNGYGKHVIVEHNDAMTSVYAHMTKTEVKEGQLVTKDTELGTVGATGWATGNHLHLEILQNNVPLNPMEVLPEFKPNRNDPVVKKEEDSMTPNFQELL